MWLVAVAMLTLKPDAIYVAVDGNDSWSGRPVRPNRDGTDGPLRTIQAANDRAVSTKVFSVQIEAGHYRTETPLQFKGLRRAWPQEPALQFSAYKGGDVCIDGSRRVTEWQVDSRGWWHTKLPDVASGKWNFIQLWVNGQRRYRPRSTGVGYATIADRVDATPASAGKGFDRFVYSPGDIDPNWHNLNDIEILAFHTWSMARMRIKSIDGSSRTVTFTGHSAAVADWSTFPKGNRYIVENVREALGRPGDWYLDRSTGELTYVPKAGETPAKSDVEAPVASSLADINGDGYRFVGITFQFTNWITPDDGHDFPQADIDVPAVISCQTSEATQFSKCTIRHTGGYAVEFGPHAFEGGIESSTMTDLGAGGVKIDPHSDGRDGRRGPAIQNCRLVSGGRLHPAAVGIWIGDSDWNFVLRNEIRDFYYTGVSVGWTWGYAPTHSGNNLIEHNEISHIGQHVLSDMGGIYTLGDQTQTHLHGNVIHDVTCFAYGGWGIYPDEGTTNEVIENNIVYRCQSAGFHQHYGKNNLVRNNIFALNGDYEVMRTRAEDHLSFTFDRNIIAWAGGAPFGSNWTGNGFLMKNDLYWHYGGPVSAPVQEPGASVRDPMFVDPTHGDFRLRAGSPARSQGFEEISTNLVGPQDKDSPPLVRDAPRAFPDPFAKP